MSDVLNEILDELEDLESDLPDDEETDVPTEEPKEEPDEKLAMLRVMLDDPTATDELLNVYMAIAKRKILQRAFPYDNTVTEVPPQYELTQCEIAAYLINKRGGEGEISHTENGITRMYENADVPVSLMRAIVPFTSVPGFKKEVVDESTTEEQE